MKRIGFFFLCFYWFTLGVKAQQISTDPNVSLASLVEGLLGSDCVEISNISSPFNGSTDGLSSFGAFSRANSNFPFTNGVILTTGDVNEAGNTLINSPLNEGTENWGTDLDLENTLGISNTLNATTLAFEFVSAVNTIQFNYILASEEYQQEYPCFYSDGFAILYKKAGTNEPFQNIALVPGTNIEVNTSNIHDNIEGFCEAENEDYFEGYNVGDTNYNGRTKVLSANASIEPNITYLIKFIIADNVDESFDSAVFIEGNSFNASVDLGPDIDTCASSVDLNADTGNSLSQYDWYLNDVLLVSTTNPILNVTASGEYKVVVNSPIGMNTCTIEDSIIVNIEQEQNAAPISDFVVCDDLSNDGTETFDLNTKIPELLDSVTPSDYNITFFASASDAQTSNNALGSIVQNTSSPQTIFVRIEDVYTGCLAFPTFDLVVNPLPTAVALPPFLLCQNQVEDNISPIDLSMFNEALSEGNSDIAVSYHHSIDDALNDLAPIDLPYNNPNSSEIIYVRLENEVSGCVNTSSLEIQFLPSLPIPQNGAFIDLCLDPSEQFGVFNLNSVVNGLLNGLTGVTISFHESMDHAQQGLNPIPNPDNYQNTNPNFQLIYIRFEDDSTQCPTISTLALHVNLLSNAFSDEFVSDLCDDVSNDGSANFDLQVVKQEVTQGLIDLEIHLYETLTDLNNQTNTLDDSVPYPVSGGQEIIYAEILSSTCSTVVEVTLLINPATIVNPVSIDYCDDAISDGTTDIVLNNLNQAALQGITNGSVQYYLNQVDAETATNEILGTYTNTSNPQQFFVRVTNNNTNCSGITTIDVQIIDRPELNQPSPLATCDLDGNGIESIDLTEKINEITTTPGNMGFSYHLNYDNAEADTNAISDPQNFQTASTTVYIRTEDNSTFCYEIIPLEVIVNAIPEIISISPFVSCSPNGVETADFLLSEKDEEILNGQTDKVVLYFETESDALVGSNPISSNLIYQNISNPQILYYRIENVSDPNCFAAGSFDLEVRSAPLYNEPSDIFVCNNQSDNNQATVDLNETIFEISNESSDNLSISFHPTLTDAQNNSNAHPLNFTNSINPEPLFARIQNQEGCTDIKSFEMNVVALPLINPAPDLTTCDTDYDGQVAWDLTQVESEVVNIRQDNIEIRYYSDMDDLEQDTNPISDPTNFTNTFLEETVYIKVTNTISNCYSYESINLLVNLPPAINQFIEYNICASPSNTVDLSDMDSLVYTGNPSDVSISYFHSFQDAEAELNPLPTDYTYINTTEELFVKVIDNSLGCYIIYPFELKVNAAPVPGPVSDLESCDDDFDGITTFNFSEQTANVLNGLDPNAHTVTYYSSQEDAEADINPLSTTSFAENDQTIFIRLQETATGCYTLVSFKTIVHEKPPLSIPRQTLCAEVPSISVDANTGIPGETYLWSTGETTSAIDITETGEYSVTVTTPFGCATTDNFEVISSESAFVELIETVDFSDPNNIIITISGAGDYLFSLDDGPTQESNVFENVSLGIHLITITDKNGCASITRSVIVVDAPKFFTPNGDGVNDNWHIIGIETIPGATVSIFDRFGKHLSQISSNTDGWDGTYNGNPMPAGDYWFTAEVNKNNERFEVQGHFSLRR